MDRIIDKLTVGNIRIEDRNTNDAYDTGEPISSDDGRDLTPDSKEVQAVLKQLGIGSLAGIQLTPASDYLKRFEFAERFARKGKREAMEAEIGYALDLAKLAGLTFDGIRMHRLYDVCAAAEKGLIESQTVAVEGN